MNAAKATITLEAVFNPLQPDDNLVSDICRSVNSVHNILHNECFILQRSLEIEQHLITPVVSAYIIAVVVSKWREFSVAQP